MAKAENVSIHSCIFVRVEVLLLWYLGICVEIIDMICLIYSFRCGARSMQIPQHNPIAFSLSLTLGSSSAEEYQGNWAIGDRRKAALRRRVIAIKRISGLCLC